MADKTRKQDSAIPAEVSELIAESSTIQGWIDRLEVLRDDTRPEVFEKVRTDYRVRLDTVTEKLGEHRSGLLETLRTRRTALDELEAEREECDAELAEATLRHAVGEFTDDAFEERREAVEGELSSLDARLADERAGVEELESILDAMPGEEGAPPVPIEAASSDGVPEAASEEASDTPPEEATDAPPGSAALSTRASSGDTHAEAEGAERQVAGEERAATEGADTKIVIEAAGDSDGTDAADATPAVESDGADYLDELEFLESLSLEDSDRFDAVSAMLDDDEPEKGTGK